MRRPALLTLLAAVACSALVGCRPPVRAPKAPPALCSKVLPKALRDNAPDTLPPSLWFELLFKGDPTARSSDPVDCAGEPIAWPPLPESCAGHEARAEPMHTAGGPRAEDLVLRHAGGEYWFGWAPMRTFDDGMSEGPIAIARVHHGALEVRAVGSLRAYRQRARLQVRKLGREHILIAEGEHCERQEGCVRGTRVMWLDHQRFRARPLRSARSRSCLGPAWFPHRETISASLGERWSRVLRRDTELAYEDEQIVADERIRVHDIDLAQRELPPRLFREAQARTRITLVDGEFVSEGRSLWNAIRIEDGSTQAGASPSAQRP